MSVACKLNTVYRDLKFRLVTNLTLRCTGGGGGLTGISGKLLRYLREDAFAENRREREKWSG